MAFTATANEKAGSPMVRLDRRKLRLRRQLEGLNQAELARAAGISYSYVGHLESGRRPTLSPGAYVRICEALRVQDRTELLAPEESDSNAQEGQS